MKKNEGCPATLTRGEGKLTWTSSCVDSLAEVSVESLSLEFFCGTPESCCWDGGGVCGPVVMELSVSICMISCDIKAVRLAWNSESMGETRGIPSVPVCFGDSGGSCTMFSVILAS